MIAGNKAKILLINPKKLIEPPIGLLSVASVLEKDGHDVSVFELPLFKDRQEARDLESYIGKKISGAPVELVGLTCLSPDSGVVKRIVLYLKREHPGIRVIAGGVHPTIRPQEVLSWGADVVVRGEGEDTVREVIRYFAEGGSLEKIRGIAFHRDGNMITTGERALIADLDQLPMPAYHLLDGLRFSRRSYSIRGKWMRCAAIITSRGCFGRCTFCASNSVHKRSLRLMGVKRVMEEIEYLIGRYRIEGLYISDDSFTLNRNRVFDFCDELKRRKICLGWACQSRVGGLTEEMLKSMKASGLLQIEFGVESGSQRILDLLKKGIRVEQTVMEFELCRRHGIRTLANIIIGSPGETMEDIDMTRALVEKIRPDFTAAFFCTPFPGTEMYDEAVRRGIMKSDQETDWQMITEPMFTAEIPKEELLKAYDALQKDNSGFFFEYLKNMNFLADMLNWTLRHPALMARLLYCYSTGRRYEAQNIFLNIFRRYHLNA